MFIDRKKISSISTQRLEGSKGQWKKRKEGSGEFVEQRFGLYQIGAVEAFDEPAVDFREHRASFFSLALPAPQPAQAHRRAQLERFRVRVARQADGLLKA